MIRLNKEQTEKATKLLGLLCKSNNLNNLQVASFFNNDDNEAIFICGELEKMDFLRVVSSGIKILSLDKKEKTCNAFENNLLMKDFIQNEKKYEKERLETDIAELTKINLSLQNRKLKREIWIGIISFIAGTIVANLKDILTMLKTIMNQ